MNLSLYSPKNFQPSLPIVLLAGRGNYPRLVWEGMSILCPNARIFSFEPENSEWLNTIPTERWSSFEIGQVGTWLKALRQCGARYALLAGQIRPKKLFHGLKPDLKALLLLSRLKEKNATTIFGALLAEIERLGIEVLDARCFMKEHVTTTGLLTKKEYFNIASETLQHGIKVCRGIAELDIGQSVIVRNGTTLLVEGFDGTDALIERVASICKDGMGLVKAAKENQDFRFDVPIFGLRTLQKMHASNIRWAALESGRTLILDKKAVLAEADRLKITLLGFE
ncbi:MAG: UDP-2,3-diacylglucosamine diphosphatase LpxI [Opitutales bacterium]|nr:UDP-2,3-diacylglucosamine diphosphatase LpxI [Opitutales bacterium]